ncbi:MAG: insulinase family protein [Candidatus Cloacimonetes bacterium]|nr:insulinase family protein [Candidatus Cloacimonadota bacterium]MCF7815330.1 insulinase family protein [Candidatus Cloacimonadota bacterium]MCF7869118.1 insulinase family protein [Candidatus Cloacimonadota bacterium]MCF7884545.1 insulinase family protein [Candidatus Cloacimonadota bacterium]
MKKIIILIGILLIISILSANNLIVKTLPNGMQVAVKENRINESVGFYCFVKTGAVNEGKYLGAGISHYLEHIVSGGATKYHTEDEYQQMGKEMGSLVNAYTTDVMTAFHIEVSKDYQDMALENISEQLTSCVCDSFEVAREKEVILKEIVMRSSPPRSKMYQRNNELVYTRSNRSFPVIGYTNLFRKITRDGLEDYYKQRYAPNNMIFVAVGDFAAEEMLQKIETAFQNFERRQMQPVNLPAENVRNGSIEYVEEFEVEQATTFITYILPAAYYADTPALETAFDILFDKRKSPIKYKLIEELNLVNYIYGYVSGSANEPEGSINIVFEAKDPAKVNEIVQIIDDEIKKYSISGFEQNQIQTIINTKKAERLLTNPSIGRDANVIGWSLLRYGIADYYPVEMAILEKMSPEELSKALLDHVVPKNRVVFHAVPKGTKALLENQQQRIVVKTDIEKIELKKDLTLLYRKNTEKPFIQGIINLPICSRYESLENVGTLSFMIGLMLSGSKKYDSLEITEWFEDHAVDFDVSVRQNSTFIEFKCLKDDYPELQKIMIDAFQNPSFSKQEIALAQENADANYKRSLSNPYKWHNEFVSSELYGNTIFGATSEQELNNILSFKRKDLKEMHERYFLVENALITLTGDLEKDEAEKYARELFKNIPNGKIDFEKKMLIVPDIDKTFVNQYNFEQVNIAINSIAPSQDDADAITMRVINLILNGSRGRIHKAVRGTNDLAYYGYASYGYNRDHGFLRLNSQTSIDRKDELVDVLLGELDKLKNEPVSMEEINSAIEENEKTMKTYMNDNRLPYYATYYEAKGLGFDYPATSTKVLKQVTPDDIMRVAKKYFQNTAIFVSEPSENVELIVK